MEQLLLSYWTYPCDDTISFCSLGVTYVVLGDTATCKTVWSILLEMCKNSKCFCYFLKLTEVFKYIKNLDNLFNVELPDINNFVLPFGEDIRNFDRKNKKNLWNGLLMGWSLSK